MNRKAFTMIEIIAIIALLGIIMIIALPNFFSSRDEINIKERQKKVEIIINSGRQYLINTDNTVGETVTIATLCSEGYLQCPVIDPVDSTSMTGTVESYLNAEGEMTYRYID